MKKKFVNIVLALFLGIASFITTAFSAGGIFAFAKMGKGTNNATQYETEDATFAKVSGDIWNSSTSNINASSVKTLLSYLTGEDTTTNSKINNLAASTMNSADIRKVVYGTNKTAGQNVLVTLGGLEWEVVYLSMDNNGNPILTLWLSNNSQEAFKGRSQTEGEYYGYLNHTETGLTGLFSSYSAGYDQVDKKYEYVSNVYGVSYVRAVTLNNGGKYGTSSTSFALATKSSTNVFAPFTISKDGEYNDITDFLITPANVSWQEYQSNKEINDFTNYHNDSWSAESGDTYSASQYFSAWKDDFLWLPSEAETGTRGDGDGTNSDGSYKPNDSGLWRTNASQRTNFTGSTTINYNLLNDNASYKVGSKTTSRYMYASTGTRSTDYNTAQKVIMISPSSASESHDTMDPFAVRPALHLNLNAIFDATSTITSDAVYIDGVNGSDANDGLTPSTPVKTVQVAESLAKNGGTIYVMNTVTLTSNTVLGENKNVTYKRYYESEIFNFTGVLFEAGIYDSANTNNNKHINLTLKNAVIDGNSLKNDTLTGITNWFYQNNSTKAFKANGSLILATNAQIVLENNSGLQNNYFRIDGSVSNGSGIYLNNNSTVIINGGTYKNLCAYNQGGVIFNNGLGVVTINDGLFMDNYTTSGGIIFQMSEKGANKLVVNGGEFGKWIDENNNNVVEDDEIHMNYGQYSPLFAGSTASNSEITINGGTYCYNNNTSGSGAIASLNHGTVNVNGGYYYKNKIQVGENGTKGVVFNVSANSSTTGKLNITGGVFEENYVQENTSKDKSYGGVVSVGLNCTAIIKNATFKGNSSYAGGAVYVNNGYCVIDNCYFEGNFATKDVQVDTSEDGQTNYTLSGGAIAVNGGTLTVKNSQFVGNYAVNGGGAIDNYNGSITIDFSTFTNNYLASTKNTGYTVGGAVKTLLGSCNITDCTFTGNNTTNNGTSKFGYGGAVGTVSGADSTGEIRNSKFYNNYSSLGGATRCSKVYNCYFKGNYSTGEAGATSATEATDSIFEDNTAATFGGAGAYGSYTNCKFYNNSATTYGGALHRPGSVTECYFTGNTSKNGGAIYAMNGLAIYGVIIENNYATESGAGICWEPNADNYKLTFNGRKNKKYEVIIYNNFIGTPSASGEQSNVCINNSTYAQPNLELRTNFTEGSIVGLNFTDNSKMQEGILMPGADGFITYIAPQTVNAFVSDDGAFGFYAGSGTVNGTELPVIYIKKLSNASGVINYVASDTFASYNGLAQTIDIKVLNVTDYTILYALEEDGVYSSTPITVTEPGASIAVWFKISATGYTTTTPEKRTITINKLTLHIGDSSVTVNAYLGQKLTNKADVTTYVSGFVYDELGNEVACSFIWNSETLEVLESHNNKSVGSLIIMPYNSEKYETLTLTNHVIKINYKNIYYKDSAFYPSEDGLNILDETIKVSVSTIALDKILTYLKNNGSIIFASTYTVSSNLNIATNNIVTFKRATGFVGDMFNIGSSATATFGSLNMLGGIVFNDGVKDITSSTLSPVSGSYIKNAGILNVLGNVTFKNVVTSASGSAINSNSSKLVTINGATFENMRTKLNGSAMYFAGSGPVKIYNAVIKNNIVNGAGTIYYESSNKLTINNTNIYNNKARNKFNTEDTTPYGFGLAIAKGSAEISFTNIYDNIFDGTLVVNNRNTHAYMKGGAIYVKGATVDISYTNMYGNVSFSGAGVYADENSNITITQTNIKNNSVVAYGVLYVSKNATVDFRSGVMSYNTSTGTVSGVGGVNVYVAGENSKFMFGADNLQDTEISNTTKLQKRGTVIWCEKGGYFEILGGKIINNSMQGGNFIHIDENSTGYFKDGIITNNYFTGATNWGGVVAPIIVKGTLILQNTIVNSVIAVGLTSTNTASLQLASDLSQQNYLTILIGEVYPNGAFLSAYTDLFKPASYEQWQGILAKIKFSSGSVNGSASLDKVVYYDSYNNSYTFNIDGPNDASATVIYFNPTSGNDSNNGSSASTAVKTWDKALEKSKSGSTIYLTSTWSISANTTINGMGRVLKRHTSLTGYMLQITNNGITLNINNLTLDGNKLKDGTVTAGNYDSYLQAKSVIFTDKKCTINLYGNVNIQNNCSTTGGAGIGASISSGNDLTLNISSTNFINNTVYHSASSYGWNVDNLPAGGAILIYSINDSTKSDLSVNIYNANINNNDVYNCMTSGSDSRASSGAGITIIRRSNISKFDFNMEDCQVNNNRYVIKDYNTSHDVGAVALSLSVVSETACDVNVNIINTQFKNNKVDGITGGNATTITVYRESSNYIVNSFTNVKIQGCLFEDNYYNNGNEVYIFPYQSKGEINFIDNTIKNDNYLQYTFRVVGSETNTSDRIVLVKNCKFDAASNYLIYNDTSSYFTIENCDFYRAENAYGSNMKGVDMNFVNCNFYNIKNVFVPTNASIKRLYVKNCNFTNVSNVISAGAKFEEGILFEDVNIKKGGFSSALININSSISTGFTNEIVFNNVHIEDVLTGLVINATNKLGTADLGVYPTKLILNNCSFKNVTRGYALEVGNVEVQCFNTIVSDCYSNGNRAVRCLNSKITGIKIDNCNGGIALSTSVNTMKSPIVVSNVIITNCRYGIEGATGFDPRNNTYADMADITIENCNISDCYYGFYSGFSFSARKTYIKNSTFNNCARGFYTRMDLKAGYAILEFGTDNFIEIDTCQFTNCDMGLEFNDVGLKPNDTSVTTQFKFILKNNTISNNTYCGIRTNFRNDAGRLILDIDSKTVVSKNLYGLYDASYAPLTINGGQFINNLRYGIWANTNTGSALNISGSSSSNRVVAKNNGTMYKDSTDTTLNDITFADVAGYKILLGGYVDIGFLSILSNSAGTYGIFISSNLNRSNVIKLGVREHGSVKGHKVVQLATGYTPDTTNWNYIIASFNCINWDLDTSEANVIKLGDHKTTTVTGFYFIDPNNGNDSNNGTTVNTPVKTLSKLLSITQSDSVIYVLNSIYLTSDFNAGGRTFKCFANPTGINYKFTSYIFRVENSNITISNIKIDANADREGTLSGDIGTNQSGLQLNNAIFYITGTNSSVKINNISFTNQNGNNLIFATNLKELIIDNLSTDNINPDGNGALRISNVANLVVKNSTIKNLNGGRFSCSIGTTNVTLQNCDFYNVSCVLYADVTGKVVVEDCTIDNISTSHYNSGNIFDLFSNTIPTFNNVKFYNILTGIHNRATSSAVFSNLTFHNLGSWAIYTSDSTASLAAGNKFEINNLTVTNDVCRTSVGNGVYIAGDVNVAINGCILENINNGIYVYSAVSKTSTVIIDDMQAKNVAICFANQDYYKVGVTSKISNSTAVGNSTHSYMFASIRNGIKDGDTYYFLDNVTVTGYSWAIYTQDGNNPGAGTIKINNCKFVKNYTAIDVRGVSSGTRVVKVDNSQFLDNYACVSVAEYSATTLNNCVINGNYYVFTGGGSVANSGNIYLTGNTVIDKDNILNNRASQINNLNANACLYLQDSVVFKMPLRIRANATTAPKVYLSGALTSGAYVLISLDVAYTSYIKTGNIVLSSSGSWANANTWRTSLTYVHVNNFSLATKEITSSSYQAVIGDFSGITYDVVTSDYIYFDPAGTLGGDDSNLGNSIEAPVKTWERVLAINTNKLPVYILSTWDITTNTTINGNGITLKRYVNTNDDTFKGRMIYAHQPITVVINNLIFDGGQREMDAGVIGAVWDTAAVYGVGANITLNGCTISHCGSYGGEYTKAIINHNSSNSLYNENMALYVNDCYFYDNVGTSCGDKFGLIYIKGFCPVYFTNTQFINCQQVLYIDQGGLTAFEADVRFENCYITESRTIQVPIIHLYGNNSYKTDLIFKDVVVEKTTFTSGGKVIRATEARNITIDGCTFYEQNNSSTEVINSIYLKDCKNVTLTNSTFDRSNNDKPTAFCGGDNVYIIVTDSLIVDNCNFIANNFNQDSGTGLYIVKSTTSACNISITNCTFANQRRDQGAKPSAVYVEGTADVEFNNNTIYGNVSSQGVVSINGANITAKNNNFYNNRVLGSTSAYYFKSTGDNKTLTVDGLYINSDITADTVTLLEIHFNGKNCIANINDISVKNCQLSKYGIYVRITDDRVTANVSNITFDNNILNPTNAVSALCLSGLILTIKDVNVTNNYLSTTTTRTGDVMCYFTDCSVDATRLNISNNIFHNVLLDFAVWSAGSRKDVTIKDSNISNNTTNYGIVNTRVIPQCDFKTEFINTKINNNTTYYHIVKTQNGDAIFDNVQVNNNTVLFGNAGEFSDKQLVQNVTYDTTPFVFTDLYNYTDAFRTNTGIFAINAGRASFNNVQCLNNDSATYGVVAIAPIKVVDSIISNNVAKIGAGLTSSMYADVVNSTISNNISSTFGGGVYFAGQLLLTDSFITNNTANTYGGGLFANASTATLTANNTIFSGNSAGLDGGAIYFNNNVGTLNLLDSKLIANSAVNNGAGLFTAVQGNLKGTNFSSNLIGEGSLIHFEVVKDLSISYATISGNYGNTETSTLFTFGNLNVAEGDIPTLNINYTNIYGNKTSGTAMIKITKGIYLTLTNNNIYANVNGGFVGEDGKITGDGGLINIEDGYLLLDNNILQDNFAYSGASVYFGAKGKGVFNNSKFVGHNAGRETNNVKNGIIALANGATLQIINSEISSNDVQGANGVIYNDGVLSLQNTKIYNNKTSAGSIYNAKNGLLSITDTNIYSNQSNYGGGIYNLGTANLISGNVYNNSALDVDGVVGCGGGIYNLGIFNLSGGKVYNNTASLGGGIYNKGSLILNDGEITLNTASSYGAGLYNAAGGTVTINNISINSNTPIEDLEQDFYGIGVANYGELYMYGGEINKNTNGKANNYEKTIGGAMYLGTGSYTVISGGDLNGNRAKTAAYLYVDTGANAFVKDLDLVASQISNTGTFAYVVDSTVTFENCLFTISEDLKIGKVNALELILAKDNANLTLRNCEISNIRGNGKEILITDSKFTMRGCLIKNNNSDYSSASVNEIRFGFVEITGNSAFNIKECDFVNNSTTFAGTAITLYNFVLTEDSYIDNNLFDGNTSSNNGGALSIAYFGGGQKYNLTISNNTFINNHAEKSGGAIYITCINDSAMVLRDNIFGGWEDINGNGVYDTGESLGNSAGDKGGAIYFDEIRAAANIIFTVGLTVTYNTAGTAGGGIYWMTNNNNVYFKGSMYALINNNTVGGKQNNLFVPDAANKGFLTPIFTTGSKIGISVESLGERVIAQTYENDLPITTSCFNALFSDSESMILRLDASSTPNKVIISAKPTGSELKVIANDVVYMLDSTRKVVPESAFMVYGSTDYTITYSETENGTYSLACPSYLTRGEYTIYYKVVDNNDATKFVTGSVKLKITGKLLSVDIAPVAYLNKGEALSSATFKGGLVTANGSAVAGYWQFEAGETKPEDITTKYKLVFHPYNATIYENEAYVMSVVTISYYKLYYYKDSSVSGFFTNREHTINSGIVTLSEAVELLQDQGVIYFISTYTVGDSGLLEENIIVNKKVTFARLKNFKNGAMIELPENATPLKLTFGGAYSINFDAYYSWTSWKVNSPVFINHGILTLGSNVNIIGFANMQNGSSVAENYGTLYLNGCTIMHCQAFGRTQDNLGAVIYNAGNLYINGGEYSMNKGMGVSGTSYVSRGGFAYNDGGNVYITGGRFARNRAQYGGVIYTNGGSVTMSGGYMLANLADKLGGAVYMINNAQFDINGGNIMYNYSEKYNSAIYNEDGNIYINGGNIAFNNISAFANLEDEYYSSKTNKSGFVVLLVLVLSAVALLGLGIAINVFNYKLGKKHLK